MGLQEVLDEELKEIKFSELEISKLNKVAKETILLLNKKGFNSFVGGSLAKGTLIKTGDDLDIDIFVVLNSSEEMSDFYAKVSKIKFSGELEMVHGSRDYYRININEKFFVELIPVLKNINPQEAENVTDVSLLHVNYVLTEIKKNPKLADEIKLAKAFCVAGGFYGAESYIKGFSGYSLEVLVIYFGGFVKFLKGIGKEKIIDPLKYFKNKKEVLHEINASKLISPVILVDPTYKYRNVLAGLGNEAYEKFLKYSKEFLKKPSKEFFEKKHFDSSLLKKLAKEKKSSFIEIELYTKKEKSDIAGTKMKKFFEFFVSELNRKSQEVLGKEFVYSGEGKKAKGYLVVKEKKEIEVRGPSVKMKEACEKLKKAKGSKVFEKKGYLFVKEKIDIKSLFEEVKKVENDMGAGGRIISI